MTPVLSGLVDRCVDSRSGAAQALSGLVER